MIQLHTKFVIVCMMLSFAGTTSQSQEITRPQPVWWFGLSGAANLNNYRGTTQVLNKELTVPTPFHKGSSVKPYISVLTEYRPNKVWGAMLNVAYDNRGGKFDGVMAPCNCPATLSTNLGYIAIEPSLRIAPFSNGFYIFGGPTLSFNVAKSFTYTQEKKATTKADWSEMRTTVLSAQVGAGFDIPLSSRASATQVNLSPFVSFLTDIGHDARSVESWSVYTIRAGIALKFGRARNPVAENAVTAPPQANVKPAEVDFTVRAPKAVPSNRQVKETFPLINAVFFDQGSVAIPSRYIALSPTQAASFKEEALQESQPDNLNSGRSFRQLAVYHNILNIMGDRMRASPVSSVTLSGASDKNPAEGKILAENVKAYLVTAFGINPSRISTEGRDKPLIPSEQPGATKDLPLLREGDRRVDISSSSPELLMQVGGSTAEWLKPVQITAVQDDPLDSHVIFNAGGADSLLKSWSLQITDEKGNVQKFGPYSKDQASVSGKTLLGSNAEGTYKIVLTGETNTGQVITKQSSVNLVKAEDAKQEGLRYSVLFDFDKGKTIDTYKKFLSDVIAPLIADNGTVIIHGHTDIIGDDKYNLNLSKERANGTQQVIEAALLKTGTKGVKFETYGFGKDPATAPFENTLPEELFYNRTVIIDIIPAQK